MERDGSLARAPLRRSHDFATTYRAAAVGQR